MLPLPAAEPFDSPGHAFEVAWNGVRALACVQTGGLRLNGRALRDLTPRYPEMQTLRSLLPDETIVDGELIATDAQGRPDAGALEERENADDPWSVAAGVREHPITYVVYDLLYARGRSLLHDPLHRRRAQLTDLLRSTDRIYVPRPVPAEGIALFEAAQEKGLEGIVAKRLDGRYHPGRRHPDWLLVQAVRQEDFPVVGLVPGQGGHLLEALIVGSYDGQGFPPVGRVVGGFDAQAALRLRRRLDRLAVVPAPTGHPFTQGDICWVEPKVVVGVKFSEWDAGGFLRFPIFCGLRPDVAPQECVRTPLVEPVRRQRSPVDIELPRLPL